MVSFFPITTMFCTTREAASLPPGTVLANQKPGSTSGQPERNRSQCLYLVQRGYDLQAVTDVLSAIRTG